jgi:pimeloyl-ACP methyl ester carboxylesterase
MAYWPKKWSRIHILVGGLLAGMLFAGFSTWYLYENSWGFRKLANTLKRVGPTGVGFERLPKGRPVVLEVESLSIAGEWFPPELSGDKTAAPGVLLLHGSSTSGRRLGLYPLMAERLRSKGYGVLTIDLRGFGESQDPPCLDRLGCLKQTPEARAALQFLSERPELNPDRLFVIGHSLGGQVAMEVAGEFMGLGGVVAIGPPRRVLSRLPEDFEYFRSRYSRDREMKALVPPEVFDPFIRSLALEELAGIYSRNDHPPLLLLDGERESQKDREYLENLAATMAPPVKYQTVENADHYLNVQSPLAGGWVVFDRSVLADFIQLLDDWMADQIQEGGGESAAGWMEKSA